MAQAKKSKIWWYLIAVVVLLVGGLALAKNMGWVGKEELTEVQLATVVKANITEKVSASGKIKPEVEVKISSDVSGEITELLVKEGDSVVANQLLCRVRPDNYKSLADRARAAVKSAEASAMQASAVVAQSEARLIRAKADFERNEKLYAQKVIADADIETIRANYNVAKQELESAKANQRASEFSVESAKASLKDALENLRKTDIFAPVSGIVSKLTVEKGERVVGTLQMTGTEIMRIANLNSMEALVDVNENDIVRISLGDTADIDVDSYSSSGRRFKGIVTSIANTAKASVSADAVTEFEVKVRLLSSSYQDLIKVEGKKYPFRPGMTAAVDILTKKKYGVPSVPLMAVTTRDLAKLEKADKKSEDKKSEDPDEFKVKAGKETSTKEDIKEVVFVYNNGKVELRPVKTGISDLDNIEIVSGVKEGDQIVSGPFLTISKKLKDGQKVAVESSESKSKSKVGSKKEE